MTMHAPCILDILPKLKIVVVRYFVLSVSAYRYRFINKPFLRMYNCHVKYKIFVVYFTELRSRFGVLMLVGTFYKFNISIACT